MIDGLHLAQMAKHAPDALDPDDVRMAGYALERYQNLLSSLVSYRALDGDEAEFVFVVDRATAVDVLGDMVG